MAAPGRSCLSYKREDTVIQAVCSAALSTCSAVKTTYAVKHLTIEVLVDSVSIIGTWQVISVPEEVLSCRVRPSVAPLNGSEILVMGGLSLSDGETNLLGDAIIFDSSSDYCTLALRNFAGLLQFDTSGNQAAQIGPESVVAWVRNEDQTKKMIVEFTTGPKTIKTVRKL